MSTAVMESPEFSGGTIGRLIQAYRDSGQPLDVPHIEIATWIVNNDLFDVPFETKLKQCDKLVADYLQKIHRMDPQGRSVRQYIAYRGGWTDEETGKKTQKWLWVDAFESGEAQSHAGVFTMHRSIGRDCNALAQLTASMNENNPNLRDNPIQLSWDFTEYIDTRDDADGESADPNKPR